MSFDINVYQPIDVYMRKHVGNVRLAMGDSWNPTDNLLILTLKNIDDVFWEKKKKKVVLWWCCNTTKLYFIDNIVIFKDELQTWYYN